MESRQKIIPAIVFFVIIPFIIKVNAKSNLTDPTNDLFVLVTILSFAVLLLVLIMFTYFLIKFRESNTETVRTPITHANTRKLEITWTLVAIIIVILLMIFSYPVLIKSIDEAQNVPIDEVIIVEGTGNWEWFFHFEDGSFVGPDNASRFKPTGLTDPIRWTELNIDVGKTYQFIMYNSGSFIHSFYVHELNIKMDVVPGLNNTFTVEILEAGNYEILCAEFCGTAHSYMRGMVVVS